MASLIPVNIIIGDRTYRLKIDAADEEKLRKTARLINDKIVEFKTTFAGKDMQDFIAMVLIWFALEQNRYGTEKILIKEAEERLTELDAMLHNFMESQNLK